MSTTLTAGPRLAALALLLPFAGCTFEGRTDGGSPRHTDNGGAEAHRMAVEDAAAADIVVEPLGGAPAASTAPVPTPRLGTAAQGEAAVPNSGALATPAAPATMGGATPAGTTPQTP